MTVTEANSKVIRWQGLAGSEREHLVLTESADRITAESIYMSRGGADSYAVYYRLVCDLSWFTLEVETRVIGSNTRLFLRRDSDSGAWLDENDKELTELAGTIDVDISISPFTNTLPIRRLALGQGESGDITVAYIKLPESEVQADPQRYTRIAKDKYLFESVDTEFQSQIEVDEHGIVVEYPDWFARIV
jgi:hypothetical protein